MEIRPYPYIPNEIGIPFEDIFQSFAYGVTSGTVQSGSGAELRYDLDTQLLDVQDRLYVDRLMGASVKDGLVKFEIQSRRSRLDVIRKDFPWDPHPDMFAHDFVGLSLDFFERNGIFVEACGGAWKPGSINHRVYEDELRTHNDRVAAAKATWSGRTFANYGFSEISHRDVQHHGLWTGRIITAIFHKSK